MEEKLNLRHIQVMRYITPLREGGSMPAIVEGDDDFLYVLKFRGAGQGTNALIAELIGGELARALGFRVPELVFADLDRAFGRTEPDEEIQDLLKFSEGRNLALHYLSGAMTYDPVVNAVDTLDASKIVWLDSFLMNMDRTAKNTNMLIWHKELWLIDHGASLYFHHSWHQWEQQAARPFKLIKDHVLLKNASEIEAADAEFKALITPALIDCIVDAIPDDWLKDAPFESLEAHREAYRTFLKNRVAHSAVIVNEVNDARKAFI